MPSARNKMGKKIIGIANCKKIIYQVQIDFTVTRVVSESDCFELWKAWLINKRFKYCKEFVILLKTV